MTIPRAILRPPAPRNSLSRRTPPTRPVRAVLGRALVGLMMLMLVVVPPGGAVCWPLLDGWHIHIGWSDAIGRPTTGLVVYSHRGPEKIINLHRTGFSPLVAPDVVNLSDLRPLAAGALWLMPLLTLAWLCLPDFTRQRQPQPSPLEQPPNLRLAF